MKKILIILGIIASIIILILSIHYYHISSVKGIINEIYESNGNYHSEHILDSVIKQLNPRNALDNSTDVVKEDFQIDSFTTTFDHKTMDYTYVYKVYGEENGKEKLIYQDSRNICLHIEFHGLNWIIVSCKEIS